MNALFITPSESGTGEAMTARYMAERLQAGGHGVFFLASALTANLLGTIFHERVTTLTADRARNRLLWDAALGAVHPDVIVFADYPLLFLSSGATPLASSEWIDALIRVPARLVTLDHLGYAQGPRIVYFGPPHLGLHAETFPAMPPTLEILLPCPIQEPGAVANRHGVAVRYWDLPLELDAGRRRTARRRYLESEDEYLIVHVTPGWAVRMATSLGLPYYNMLSILLERYLADLQRPATIVSVNDGGLLAERCTPALRIVNAAPMPPASFDDLLLAADLVVTDNKVSVSLAKAACAMIPAVVLRNSYSLGHLMTSAEPGIVEVIQAMERERAGSVFPHEVFPIWSPSDVDELGLFSANTYADAIVCVELFGGDATRRELVALLTDDSRRRSLASRQHAYASSIARLPAAEDLLASQPHNDGVPA
jgi:Family of unknown function (DUF6365)